MFFFICLWSLVKHKLGKISEFVISEGRNLDLIIFLSDEYYSEILCLPLRKQLDYNFLGYLVGLDSHSFERWTFVKHLERSIITSELRYWSRNLVKGSLHRRLTLLVLVLLCPVFGFSCIYLDLGFYCIYSVFDGKLSLNNNLRYWDSSSITGLLVHPLTQNKFSRSPKKFRISLCLNFCLWLCLQKAMNSVKVVTGW